MKIGVFDSGIGGKSVALAIQRALPNDEIVFKNDTSNLPYGDKHPNELFGLVVPILRGLVYEGCEVIVIACNTVTTNLINKLREVIDVPLIGVEPMIKPAASITETGVVAVCATPATLRSERYILLKRSFASNCQIVEPDCSDWARLIENGEMNKSRIITDLKPAVDAGADVIVLGCTHYHWIENIIRSLVASNVKVIQPENAIINRIKQIITK